MDANDREERDAFLAQTEAYLKGNDWPAVLDLAQGRLERLPGDLDARMAICRVWIQQGRMDEAREMLREMDETITSLSQIYACMGDAYLKKGMMEETGRYYRKFLALNPGVPLAGDVSEKLRSIEEQRETAAAEGEEEAQIPSAFQTATLAELYIRQGHLPMAAEVLEAILRKEPQQERAAGMLREVREMIRREASAQRVAPVIAELSRWLENIVRLRVHAA
ncbi:MAG: tetratricopeptide repeat protein [Proteobacteria bacterium]|nr:tetratricopeptide repeat protein [Pseudomonadota bacterium]